MTLRWDCLQWMETHAMYNAWIVKWKITSVKLFQCLHPVCVWESLFSVCAHAHWIISPFALMVPKLLQLAQPGNQHGHHQTARTPKWEHLLRWRSAHHIHLLLQEFASLKLWYQTCKQCCKKTREELKKVTVTGTERWRGEDRKDGKEKLTLVEKLGGWEEYWDVVFWGKGSNRYRD